MKRKLSFWEKPLQHLILAGRTKVRAGSKRGRKSLQRRSVAYRALAPYGFLSDTSDCICAQKLWVVPKTP